MSKKTKRKNKRRRKSRKNMCGGSALLRPIPDYIPPPEAYHSAIAEHLGALQGTELEWMFGWPSLEATEPPFSEDVYVLFAPTGTWPATREGWGREEWIYNILRHEYEVIWQQLLTIINTPGWVPPFGGLAEDFIARLRQKLRAYRNGILYWIYRYRHLYLRYREHFDNVTQHMHGEHYDIVPDQQN